MFNAIRSIGSSIGSSLSTLGGDIRSLAIGQEKSRDVNAGRAISSPLFCGGLTLNADGSNGIQSGLGQMDAAQTSYLDTYQMTGTDKLNRVLKYGMWGAAGISWIKFLKDPSFGKLAMATILTLGAAGIGKQLDNKLNERALAANGGRSMESELQKETESWHKAGDKSKSKTPPGKNMRTIKTKNNKSVTLRMKDASDPQAGMLDSLSIKDASGKPMGGMQFKYDKNNKISSVAVADKNGLKVYSSPKEMEEFNKRYPGTMSKVNQMNISTLQKQRQKAQTRQPGKTQQKSVSPGVRGLQTRTPVVRAV